MKLNKKTAKLICDIENIIGNYCWNDNSTYGDGGYIRYPVWANMTKQETNFELNKKVETQKWEKFSYTNLNNANPPLKPKEIETLEYHFGANDLVIGRAIIDVLGLLENRYNLDFSQLEKEKIIKEKNRQDEEMSISNKKVSFSMMLAYPEQYEVLEFSEEGKEIEIKDTLVLCENNLREKYFYVCLSIGEGKYDFDKSKYIKVYYNKLPNIKTYIELTASYQKIRIKGKLILSFDYTFDDFNPEKEHYIRATKIKFL